MALPAEASSVIRFGAFELDAVNGELRKAGVSLKIHPQPLQVLLLLAQHAGQTVTRDEIRHCLWGDNTFVDFERGINFCVNQIRATLGDDAEKPQYVETLPRRGYRFIAPVSISSSPTVDGRISEQPTDEGARRLAVSVGEVKAVLPPAGHALTWMKRYLLAALVAAAVTVALAVVAMHRWRDHRAVLHSPKDAIVLADFSNSTGDPVFDGTLRQGLAVQLQQSPFLSFVSDERIRQTLRLMGRAPDTKLTPEIGRELCQRTDSAAVLSGSIASLGSQYVLDVKAVNCETGDSLAEEQETADGKEKVLAALSQAATKLRGRLGESLKSIEKFDAPLEQATTSSLPALQSYSLGRKTFTGGDMASAVSPLQRAIQLDPSFAQAYAALGVTYMNRGEFGLAEDNMRKAYQLRERVSEQERFFIDLHYYEDAAGDLEKARQVGELWAQTYPRSSFPFGNLGGTYLVLGQHDKALVAFHEALRLDPDVPTRELRLATVYMRLNRFQDALALAKQLQSRGSDTGDLHVLLYQIALCENDAPGIAREVAWSVDKAVYEHLFLNLEAGRAAYYGKIRKARELVDRATNLAEREQQKQTAANYQGWQALAEAFFGDGAEAQKRATAALKLSSTKEVIILAAIAGERARTEQLIADLNKRYPDHTFLRNTWLPLASAQFALQRNGPQTAIEVLQRAQPYELGLGDNLLSSFVRGEAYLAMHSTTDAIAAFQKILDHRGIVLLAPLGALAHLGLARAYALQGDTAKAKAAYHDFFGLWKDADLDVPVLKQAKAEYANLQ